MVEEQIKECERWLRAPKVIGGFELINKIGQGGMGSVFKARQLSMDRDVALKILPPSLAQDPSFKDRFLHEARLSAKFNHLNIISGIDCGEDKGLTFFAMELVDGRTLKEILKDKGKLDSAEAAQVILQVAEALVGDEEPEGGKHQRVVEPPARGRMAVDRLVLQRGVLRQEQGEPGDGESRPEVGGEDRDGPPAGVGQNEDRERRQLDPRRARGGWRHFPFTRSDLRGV